MPANNKLPLRGSRAASRWVLGLKADSQALQITFSSPSARGRFKHHRASLAVVRCLLLQRAARHIGALQLSALNIVWV
jgi:hypothetical protein